MIDREYMAVVQMKHTGHKGRGWGERLLWEEAQVLYWLVVRAGVVGRRAERADILAAALGDIRAPYCEEISNGDHIGAARRYR